MIPKIIHYCWFGGLPLTPLAAQCLASWRELHPDYVIRRWDETNAPIHENEFVRGAYESRRWAFVADYIRFWALAGEGGIYLDTDMLLIKPLDAFLNASCFIGAENETWVSGGIIGAAAGHSYILAVKQQYENLIYDEVYRPTIPQVLTSKLKDKGFISCSSILSVNEVTVYPAPYFYPLPFERRLEKDFTRYLTPETHGVHLWAASWHQEWMDFRNGRYRTGLKKAVDQLRRSKSVSPLYWLKLLYFLLLINRLRAFTIRSWNAVLRRLIKFPLFEEWIVTHTSIERRLKIAPPDGHIHKNQEIAFSRQGISYQLDPNEHNTWRVRFNLFLLGTERFFQAIRENSIVLDIGANNGYYSLIAAKRAVRGRVYAFEPYPDNYKTLIRQIRINQFENIFPFPLALGADNREVCLEVINPRNLGQISVALHQNQQHESESVLQRRLDDWMAESGPDQVDVIKLDIEGYEEEFLKGAEATLRRYRPLLFLEVYDQQLKKHGSSAKSLFKRLERYGYAIKAADNLHTLSSHHYLEDCFLDIFCEPVR